MARIDLVLNEVLKEISLSFEEKARYEKIAKDVVKKLEGEGFKSFLGGSLAKNTMIKKDFQDLDIFVVFKEIEKKDILESVLKKLGFDFDVVHGSRDYYRLKFDSVLVELIPVSKFTIPEEAENVTDFSLRHVKWVKGKIDENPGLADDIRLAKSFCFAQDVYGAESYIQGFSGYALEVLVIYFKSFKKFLKWFVKNFKKRIVLDPESHFKNTKEILREVNESKLLSPLIVIDPTYKFRNVTASLSEEIFYKFVESAKKFLKNPSKDFFVKKEIDIGGLKSLAEKKGARFVEMEFETDRQEGDIAGTKMKKLFRLMCSVLEKNNQEILKSEFVYPGNGRLAKGYLVIQENTEKEIEGPLLSMKKAVQNFKRVRKKTYKKGKRIYAKERIDLKEIFSFLKRFEKEMAVRFKVL